MMPTVAVIEGVKIQFYYDEHPPPHFHATFAEFVAQIQIDPPQLLRGSLPPAKLAIVLAWAEANREPLRSAWLAIAAGQKPTRLQ